MTETTDLLDMTADIVAAFVGNNTMRAGELPDLIAVVHASLSGIGVPKLAEETAPQLKPAVPVRKSITDDFIICLEDGKKFKSMRRHLAQALGLTPEAYRAKWGLPANYPMVAPSYAAKRSAMAKSLGLGNKRGKAVEAIMPPPIAVPVAPPVPEAAPAKRRSRPKKAA